MSLPKRKSLRLKNFDYSSSGAYFITLCTLQQKHLFSDPRVSLEMGRVFERVMDYYAPVRSPKYTVMPNHFHAIIEMYGASENPTQLSAIVKSYKRESTKAFKELMQKGVVPVTATPIWQKSFHDRVIRDDREYRKAWEYIENNEKQWELDGK